MLRSCRKVAEWMSGYKRPWGIAGGWAIDLFVGGQTRDHSDIEIAILREDQHEMRGALADWSFQKAVKGKLLEWGSETLKLPIHELHGVNRTGEHLEVLLNEVENDQWIFRRNPAIAFPSSTLLLTSKEGIPYLHPAVVLLYKSKNPQEKDHADFHAVKDLLSEEDQQWLQHSLKIHVPDNEWVSQLRGMVE
ncbi:nucleotidyltransferase domain-containing protein [Sporosarcina sp. SAFN-015]|uniref:nucleotidyltransferase domain-containing protein n=1 Tax=Sporosarcina sp. SAFN-015 TaxID=3387274 RepID=UPI003F7DD07F